MTVENTTNKMTAQQMGESYDYYFNFVVLLTDPTEEEAMAGIKATVKDSDGNETELTYNSSDTDGYTVTLNSSGIGGKITVNDMRSTSDYITIYREYDLTQEADFQDFNAAPADTTEQCFDKGIMVAQQLQEGLSRAIKVSVTSSVTDLSLPEPDAGKTLKWNEAETGLINSDVSIDELDEYITTAKEYSQTAAEQAEIATQQATAAAEILSEITSAQEAAEESIEDSVNLAKDWANKTDDTVDGEEYSAKYYAELTASTADTAISNIETAEEEAIANIETAGVYLYSSYVSGATWYRLYSDGFLMQGGTLSGTGSWGYTSITLPHAFKNTNYQVVTTCYHTTASEYTDDSYDTLRGSVDKSGCVYTKSTSAFSPASRKTKMWVAFGQANL